jgi:hypothetical protein
MVLRILNSFKIQLLILFNWKNDHKGGKTHVIIKTDKLSTSLVQSDFQDRAKMVETRTTSWMLLHLSVRSRCVILHSLPNKRNQRALNHVAEAVANRQADLIQTQQWRTQKVLTASLSCFI